MKNIWNRWNTVGHKPPAVVNLFNLLLSLFTWCARPSHHLCHVRSFDTIYHPTDFTVMNEILKATMYRKFYAVFVIWTTNRKKNPTKTEKTNKAKTLQM